MARSTLVKTVLSSFAFVLAGILIGSLFFGGTAGSLLRTEPVAAQTDPDPSLFRDPASPDAPLDVANCLPYSVAVFTNRIHVECNMSAPTPAFRFFAMSNSSSAQTARILSVLEAAHVSGKRLWIGFDPSDLSGQASIGCNNSDCRLIQSAAIQP